MAGVNALASKSLFQHFCRIVLLTTTIIALIPATEAGAASTSGRPQRWAFYVNYDPSSKASLLEHLNDVDVVVPNYYNVIASGAVVGSGDSNLDVQLTSSGKRILPLVQSSVDGADLTPFLTDPATRAKLISGLCADSSQTAYVGLTLDFEAVSANDRSAYSSFIRDLGTCLHGMGKTLAVAVPAGEGSAPTGWSAAYDDAAIGGSADFVILMAYAYRTALNPVPGPISPLPWFANVTAYAASHVAPSRLVLGIGLWGYDWNLSRPGHAATERYDDVIAQIERNGGQPRFDDLNAAPAYDYTSTSNRHQIWYEDAVSVSRKVAVGESFGVGAVAFWRLGQEDPALWSVLDRSPSGDFAIPNGWFFSQTGGGSGLGFRVVDEGSHFWTELRRLGGVATLGYPSSRPYVGADGLTYQAFQRGLLQWRPELGIAYLANTFDMLTAVRQDQVLTADGIPSSVGDDGSGGNWDRARQTRLEWLTDPRIAAKFMTNPNTSDIPEWDVTRSIELYGLPASRPARSGPFIVQRFQRISLQLWLDDVPGMPPPGSVVGILGGDLIKKAGIIPAGASIPEAPY
jgi:spore germination protein YaaH